MIRPGNIKTVVHECRCGCETIIYFDTNDILMFVHGVTAGKPESIRHIDEGGMINGKWSTSNATEKKIRRELSIKELGF